MHKSIAGVTPPEPSGGIVKLESKTESLLSCVMETFKPDCETDFTMPLIEPRLESVVVILLFTTNKESSRAAALKDTVPVPPE